MRPKRRPKTLRCRGCGQRIKVSAKGRVPTFCGQGCKQRAYLKRRRVGPMELLAQDLATARVRAVIRDEIWKILTQAGLVGGDLPPPPTKPRRAGPQLRVIDTAADDTKTDQTQ